MALDRDALTRLHEAMLAHVTAGEWPGMVTLLARGDDVEVDAIGRMSFDGDEPMRRDAVFRIASLTKPILAAAAMTQIEDGAYALDEPVDRLLPELVDRRVLRRLDGPLDDTVPARRPIIVEDLLTLRMGYGFIAKPEVNPPYPIIRAAEELRLVMAEPDPRTPYEPDEWIRRFGTLPLMGQPGEEWFYNAGALVLGVFVARAAGAPLGDVLRDRILAPLGMHDTGFSVPPGQMHRLPDAFGTDHATGHMRTLDETPREDWSRPPAFPSGAGGLVSTADDYLKFARMMMRCGAYDGGRLLSEASVAAMTTNHLTPEQIEGGGIFTDGHGYGYGVGTDYAGPPESYGWAGGSGTWWFNNPVTDLTGIALTQVPDFLWLGAEEFARLSGEA